MRSRAIYFFLGFATALMLTVASDPVISAEIYRVGVAHSHWTRSNIIGPWTGNAGCSGTGTNQYIQMASDVTSAYLRHDSDKFNTAGYRNVKVSYYLRGDNKLMPLAVRVYNNTGGWQTIENVSSQSNCSQHTPSVSNSIKNITRLSFDFAGTKGQWALMSLDVVVTGDCGDPPTSASNTGPIYAGESVTLSYIGGSGNELKWYTDSCGGNYIGSGQNLSVSPAETTTYYCRWEASCGNSTCVSTTVTVTQPPIEPISIGEAKQKADNDSTTLSGKEVTAVFTDHFYIEEKDRSSGIMVVPSSMPEGLTVGATVDVTGYLKTNAEKERFIEANSITITPGSPSIDPLGMTTKAVGGADWFFYDVDSEPMSVMDRSEEEEGV